MRSKVVWCRAVVRRASKITARMAGVGVSCLDGPPLLSARPPWRVRLLLLASLLTVLSISSFTFVSHNEVVCTVAQHLVDVTPRFLLGFHGSRFLDRGRSSPRKTYLVVKPRDRKTSSRCLCLYCSGLARSHRWAWFGQSFFHSQILFFFYTNWYLRLSTFPVTVIQLLMSLLGRLDKRIDMRGGDDTIRGGNP